jgi:hypothetical protein
MNLSELEKKLEENKIREDVYSLYGAEHDGRKVIKSLPNGKWQVFFSERGNKLGLREFDCESDACLHLLKSLLRSPFAKK